MPQFVLANRRSGLFTNEAKIASRACVRTALELLPTARVIANHEPADPLARNVVVLEADANQVAAVRPRLPADAMLEPIVRRKLHHRVPIELRSAVPHVARSTGASSIYKSTINGNGDPLAHADVTLYVRDAGGQLQITTVKTNANGRISFELPDGSVVAFVEPIPYFGCWIMLAEGPPSGSTIDCFPLAKAKSGGAGWWHDVMGVDITQRSRGAGIKVGVIDTGCGPHPNLKHVTLVGAFIDGKVLPPDQARDVVQHGTHTTGIVGARPTRAPDYAGIGAGCDLFHARAFKGDGPDDGPTQADVINSIDALSRDHQCDLINMSFGGELKSEAEEDAIRDAAERGTLCICSAGNEVGAIDYPAAYSECEAVSAIGKIGWAPADVLLKQSRPGRCKDGSEQSLPRQVQQFRPDPCLRGAGSWHCIHRTESRRCCRALHGDGWDVHGKSCRLRRACSYPFAGRAIPRAPAKHFTLQESGACWRSTADRSVFRLSSRGVGCPLFSVERGKTVDVNCSHGAHREQSGVVESALQAVENEPGITIVNAENPQMVTIDATEDAASRLRDKLQNTYLVEPEIRRSLD